MKRPCVLSCFVTSAVVVSLNRRAYYSFCQELLFYYLLSDGYSDIQLFFFYFRTLHLTSEKFARKVSVPSEVLFVFLSLLFRLIYILTPIQPFTICNRRHSCGKKCSISYEKYHYEPFPKLPTRSGSYILKQKQHANRVEFA